MCALYTCTIIIVIIIIFLFLLINNIQNFIHRFQKKDFLQIQEYEKLKYIP